VVVLTDSFHVFEFKKLFSFFTLFNFDASGEIHMPKYTLLTQISFRTVRNFVYWKRTRNPNIKAINQKSWTDFLRRRALQ
jgi:hypothetical protein